MENGRSLFMSKMEMPISANPSPHVAKSGHGEESQPFAQILTPIQKVSDSLGKKITSSARKRRPKIKSELIFEHQVPAKEETAMNLTFKIFLLVTAIVITGACAFLATKSLIEPKARTRLKIGSYRSALQSKVFGQPEAIDELVKKLPALYQNALEGELSVLLLSGGPGVGKDLVAQIVTSEFYAQSGENCKESSFLLLEHQGPVCKRADLNMIRFDTIVNEEDDILSAVLLIGQISKIGIRGILFVPVLAAKALNTSANETTGLENLKTVEDYNDIVKGRSIKLQKLLAVQGIKSELIVFQPLTRDTVLKCLGSNNKNVIDYVMLDREFALSGCKNLEELMIDVA